VNETDQQRAENDVQNNTCHKVLQPQTDKDIWRRDRVGLEEQLEQQKGQERKDNTKGREQRSKMQLVMSHKR
jgi:hypothetical protein